MPSSVVSASAVLMAATLAAGNNQGTIRLSRQGGDHDGNDVTAAGRFSSKGTPVDMTMTFSFNGIKAWNPSLSGTLQNFPAHYLPGRFQVATANHYQFPEDGVVEYDCPPASAGFGPCDVVVFLYECFPCKTEKGNLPAHLLSNGYQRTRCAPTFTVKPGGSQQRMTTFIKTIPAGANEVIYMPGQGKVEFVAFGLSNGGGRDCDTYTSYAQCEGPGNNGHCEWNKAASKCKLATCVQQGPGGCDLKTCATKEIL